MKNDINSKRKTKQVQTKIFEQKIFYERETYGVNYSQNTCYEKVACYTCRILKRTVKDLSTEIIMVPPSPEHSVNNSPIVVKDSMGNCLIL